MYYVVTITKFESVEQEKQEYVRMADTGNEKDNGPVYGHVKRREQVNRETQVYQQRFDVEGGISLNVPGIVTMLNEEPTKVKHEE